MNWIRVRNRWFCKFNMGVYAAVALVFWPIGLMRIFGVDWLDVIAAYLGFATMVLFLNIAQGLLDRFWKW